MPLDDQHPRDYRHIRICSAELFEKPGARNCQRVRAIDPRPKKVEVSLSVIDWHLQIPRQRSGCPLGELTQGQWNRVMERNRSVYRIDPERPPRFIDGDHPVETLSWFEAVDVVRRLGLALPTEMQGELAARAGSTYRWSMGLEEESLAGHANLADLFARCHNGSDDWVYEFFLDDFHDVHSAVGTFEPNAFGLHDVHGNVAEWCLEPRQQAHVPPRSSIGRRAQGGRWVRCKRPVNPWRESLATGLTKG